jgi:NADPH:quinone reductase-like Zn-dependent oxidoreductase
MPDPVPGTREVLVDVSFAGINPADSHRRAGKEPPGGRSTAFAGIEVAGTVVDRGPKTTRWEVGDRVFGLVDGEGLADCVVVPEQLLTRVPDPLSDEQAAATPENFITAHDALVSCGNVRPGELVLVTGANGGVGSAAVQIARAIGAQVVATARSGDGLEFVKALGATGVWHDEWLAAGAEAVGRPDLVVEIVGGPSLSLGITVLAMRGRLVTVGAALGREVTTSLRSLGDVRGSIIGTSLRRRPLEEKAAAVQLFGKEVGPLMGSGAVVPQIDSIFPWDQAAAAFDRLDSAGKRGKVLLGFGSPAG